MTFSQMAKGQCNAPPTNTACTLLSSSPKKSLSAFAIVHVSISGHTVEITKSLPALVSKRVPVAWSSMGVGKFAPALDSIRFVKQSEPNDSAHRVKPFSVKTLQTVVCARPDRVSWSCLLTSIASPGCSKLSENMRHPLLNMSVTIVCSRTRSSLISMMKSTPQLINAIFVVSSTAHAILRHFFTRVSSVRAHNRTLRSVRTGCSALEDPLDGSPG